MCAALNSHPRVVGMLLSADDIDIDITDKVSYEPHQNYHYFYLTLAFFQDGHTANHLSGHEDITRLLVMQHEREDEQKSFLLHLCFALLVAFARRFEIC